MRRSTQGKWRMSRVELRPPNEAIRPGHGEWSRRRSAAFVVAGGIVFWAIVLLIFFSARFF
jgi:hypothetical protein